MGLFPNIVTESVEFGGRTLTFETGRLAKQANGSVLVTYGETVVLVTVTSTHKPRSGMTFFPLVVDLVEKTYAAGKLPGGFFKREGRPTTNSTLASRLIDRPIRPLFPEGYMNEVQVVCTVLSVDLEADPNICGLLGTSAALMISDIPWNGPIAGCTVSRHDGEWTICAPVAKIEESDCDLLVAARPDGIVMVEGGLQEVSEDEVIEALAMRRWHQSLKPSTG
jgi:polyribonucleotide nucleotidyltransferase